MRKSGFATSGIADPRSTRCCVFPDRATCVPSCCGYFENLPQIIREIDASAKDLGYHRADETDRYHGYLIDAREATGLRFEILDRIRTHRTTDVPFRSGLLDCFNHIEIASPDPDRAKDMLIKVFGAVQNELWMSSVIEANWGSSRVIHMNLGGITLQYLRPDSDYYQSWKDLIAREGHYLHNIAIYSYDVAEINRRVGSRGELHIHSTIDRVDPDEPASQNPQIALGYPGAEDSDTFTGVSVKTMERAGLRWEFMQMFPPRHDPTLARLSHTTGYRI